MLAGETRAAAAPFILVGPLPPPIDGQSLAFELLANGLARAGVGVSVVNIARPGQQFERARAARALDYVQILSRFVRELFRQSRASVYLTVAQSRAGFLRDAAFIGLARLARRRIVIHVHGGNYDGFFAAQPPLLQGVVKRVLRATDVVIVLAERLRGMFDFAPEVAARVRAVPNGLPGAAPQQRRKLAPEPGSPWRLLFLSNLVESKGYLEAIEAAALLAKRGICVELDLCGEFRVNPSDDRRVTSTAQARAVTESRIRELGLSDRVRLRGIVRGSEKERALEEAHVLLLPTRYDAEGQPLSIIEAMAFGCAVVATAYRGIPDLVDEGVTGYLLSSADPAGIADRIERLSSGPETFERMSRAARERFDALFTAEAHIAAMRAALGC